MKKNLFIAALLCSISFAGNAATQKAKAAAIAKKPMTVTKVSELFMEVWTCPSGAYSITCYGFSHDEAMRALNYYSMNLDC